MTVLVDSARPAHTLEVLALLARICPPLAPERVSLAEALGRTLHEPARAAEDQPPFDRSAFDGYAVRLDDPTTRFRVVDEIRAGDWKPRLLGPGDAVRIATGGALPSEGLQVVMREDTQREGEWVTILRRDAERNIRSRGEDAQAGQVLIEAGLVLGPGSLALMASLGCAQPLVTRLPRVLHVATGNEIVPPEQTPAPGQIRDSNSTLVRAFLRRWGIEPEQCRVPETQSAAETAIANRPGPILAGLDLLLISGGASVGEQDFTRPLLEALGFTIHVSATTARPGKPLIVAQHGSTVAFGLPGNPLAHFVCLNLYVRGALRALTARPAEPPFHTGTLAAELEGGGNSRDTFWPSRWSLVEGTATLAPLRWSNSGDLTSLATANALIRVPAGTERLPRGSRVEFAATEAFV
jgi:molybdopterin molybdotransferase